MRVLQTIFWASMIFLSGIVFTANVSRMINGCPDHYEASYLKIAGAILFAVYSTIILNKHT